MRNSSLLLSEDLTWNQSACSRPHLYLWPVCVRLINYAAAHREASRVKTNAPRAGEQRMARWGLLTRGNTVTHEADMTPLVLLAAALLGVAAVSHVEEMKNQERLFLRSLGLSARPRAAGSHQPRRHVPPALWRMFQRSEQVQAQQNQPCVVTEYGVRGNIIRFVQDQGRPVHF